VRVLLVSDLHYDLRKLDWVLGRAGSAVDPVDVIVLAGDLLDVGSAVPLDAQITVVLSYLERLAARVPMLVCSGNHDLDCRTASGEKATRWLGEARGVGVHVDGDSFDLDGWRLTACAWWEGPETLAALEERLAEATIDRPARWLWAFHGPPEGPLSWTGSRYYGDPELPHLDVGRRTKRNVHYVGIDAIGSRDHPKQEVEVGDRTGDGPERGVTLNQAVPGHRMPGARNPAGGGLEAGEPAEVRRVANASPGVAADVER